MLLGSLNSAGFRVLTHSFGLVRCFRLYPKEGTPKRVVQDTTHPPPPPPRASSDLIRETNKMMELVGKAESLLRRLTRTKDQIQPP